MSSVGFIGLGNMGGPMARNLVMAGHAVRATDLDPVKVERAVAAGAVAAADAIDAASGADVVFTSLPGPTQVAAVADEILPVMGTGAVWVDLSTNDLTCARKIAEAASAWGVSILDAPVTGGAEGAEAGTLAVLVGGEATTFERCRSLLEVIGHRVELLGPHGAGYVAKIAQVTLCYLHSVCLTEALILGVKGGVDAGKMLEVIQHSTGRSYVADTYGPEILTGGYDPTFDLGLAAKDMRLALTMADDTGAQVPFMEAVGRLYEEAQHTYGSVAPHLEAIRLIEERNGLLLHRSGDGGSPS